MFAMLPETPNNVNIVLLILISEAILKKFI